MSQLVHLSPTTRSGVVGVIDGFLPRARVLASPALIPIDQISLTLVTAGVTSHLLGHVRHIYMPYNYDCKM